MAFTDEDLASLEDDFVAVPGRQIVTPRAHERMHGGNAGFSHVVRAVPRPEAPVVAPKKCRRCRLPAIHGVLCERHREQHRRWAVERVRRRGTKAWQPGGKGRPPNIARRAVDAAVVTQEALLSDALIELAKMNRRVRELRKALTLARKAARRRTRQQDFDAA